MKLFTLFITIFVAAFLQGCITESTSVENPKNIILILCDGLNIDNIKKDCEVNGEPFNLSRSSVYGLSKTDAALSDVANYAVNPTVVSIGHKSTDNSIGLDSNGIAQPNLIEYASVQGKATGILTVNSAVDASTSAFISHIYDKNSSEQIAVDYLISPLDVFIGGGRNYFNRTYENENLLKKLTNKGYSCSHKILNTKPDSNLFILLENNLSQSAANEELLWEKSINLSLNSLELSGSGFFLLIDMAYADSHSITEKTEYQARVNKFNNTVKLAFDYADKNPGTQVVITISRSDIENSKENEHKNIERDNQSMVTTFAYGKDANIYGGNYDVSEIYTRLSKSLE